MRLYAFEGLRYTPRAGDAGALAAPPYDQIDDAARDRFQAQSPYQFVHLTRPVAPASQAGEAPAGGGGGGDPYRHAAALHGRWLQEGIVARDERPALYPYVIDLAGGGRRLGLAGLVAFADAAEIRPHEQTLDKPLADRLALLEATHADLEPVLLLAEDGGGLDELLTADLPALAPVVVHRDADGHHHRLFQIADPQRIARYRQALEGKPAAIADGHHRYKVGQRFAREHGARPGTAAAAKLSIVTSMSSPALTIEPIHRALREPIDLERFAPIPHQAETFSGAGGSELAAAVAAAARSQPALGVWVSGKEPEIWLLNPAAAPGASPDGAPPLEVEILQATLLPALGLAPEAATDGTLVYRSNPDQLYRQVAAGELGTGFWLPPMQPKAFAAAVAKGALLPPKSTRFLPKVMSGLLWADSYSRLL
jgi:uncharacterized protein (DUF1015 family)